MYSWLTSVSIVFIFTLPCNALIVVHRSQRYMKATPMMNTTNNMIPSFYSAVVRAKVHKKNFRKVMNFFHKFLFGKDPPPPPSTLILITFFYLEPPPPPPPPPPENNNSIFVMLSMSSSKLGDGVFHFVFCTPLPPSLD